MKSELKGNITKILKELYGEQLDESQLNTYASNLEFSLNNVDNLSNLFSVAYENEFECEIEDSQAGFVFTQVRELLSPSRETATRLYECFMNCYDGFDIAVQLLNQNLEYLSEDELCKATEKAIALYDKESLKLLFVF